MENLPELQSPTETVQSDAEVMQELRSQIASAEKEADRLKAQIALTTSRAEGLETVGTEAEAEVAKLEAEVEGLQAEIKNLQAQRERETAARIAKEEAARTQLPVPPVQPVTEATAPLLLESQSPVQPVPQPGMEEEKEQQQKREAEQKKQEEERRVQEAEAEKKRQQEAEASGGGQPSITPVQAVFTVPLQEQQPSTPRLGEQPGGSQPNVFWSSKS